jgi:hypothetical protein
MNKLNKIYLDVDGVLADWQTAAIKAVGLDPGSAAVKGILAKNPRQMENLPGFERMSSCIADLGTKFWEDLQPFPWTTQLIKLATDAVGVENVALLTNPGKYAHACTGKFIWWQKHCSQLKCVITKDKYLLARPDVILVDDDARKLHEFQTYGGLTWLWQDQNALLVEGNGAVVLSSLQVYLEMLTRGYTHGLLGTKAVPAVFT